MLLLFFPRIRLEIAVRIIFDIDVIGSVYREAFGNTSMLAQHFVSSRSADYRLGVFLTVAERHLSNDGFV